MHRDSSVYQLKCSYCAYLHFLSTMSLATLILCRVSWHYAEKKVVFSQASMEGSSSKIIGTFSNPTIFMDGERIYVLFW